MAKREFSRTQRVAELIKEELAKLLQTDVKDPRLLLVTITAVEVTRDLEHAKIYVTFPQQDEVKAILQVLKKAASFLRHQLAQAIELRIIPHLNFHYDESISRGAKISDLIDRGLKNFDEE